MGRGNNSSAYRDMDEEFFVSLEEANYESHESPVKKSPSCSKLSESAILHKHLEHRQATRAKVIVALSLLLLAGVGSVALFSSVDATKLAMKMRGPCPMFRGSSTATSSFTGVFEGDDSPDFGAAILAADETVTVDDEAQDDQLLEELDPYDEFHQAGNQLEAN